MSEEDYLVYPIYATYCSVHEGMWPHECNCGAPTNEELWEEEDGIDE